jgi:hypothetical protein
LGVGTPAAWCRCDSGEPGVVEGLGAIRFGGSFFGAICAGTFPLGDCFSPGEPVGVGFPPGPVGEPPGVPEGFSHGEAPGAPEGFAPSRFGGTDLFPAAVAPGEAPGVLGDPPGTFLFGDCFSSREPGVVGFPPGPVGEPPGVPGGFTPSRFGGTDLFPAAAAMGVGFCPVTAGGEPVVPGDPACPFLPICGFT